MFSYPAVCALTDPSPMAALSLCRHNLPGEGGSGEDDSDFYPGPYRPALSFRTDVRNLTCYSEFLHGFPGRDRDLRYHKPHDLIPRPLLLKEKGGSTAHAAVCVLYLKVQYSTRQHG